MEQQQNTQETLAGAFLKLRQQQRQLEADLSQAIADRLTFFQQKTGIKVCGVEVNGSSVHVHLDLGERPSGWKFATRGGGQ